jgi:hypothetical protein
MTAQELIKSSLRTLGVIASGETPAAEELNDALAALNSMLDSWSAQGLKVPSLTQVSVPLLAGTASYSIGTGGTVAVARPSEVIGGYIRDSGGHDYPLSILSAGEYRGIGEKTTSSRPTGVFYDPSYPIGYLRFYPTPDTNETAYLDCLTPGTAIAGLTSTVNVPADYIRAIKYQLAIEIAPEYGREPSAIVAARAQEAMTAIEARAFSARMEPVSFAGMPGVAGRGYDINEG